VEWGHAGTVGRWRSPPEGWVIDKVVGQSVTTARLGGGRRAVADGDSGKLPQHQGIRVDVRHGPVEAEEAARVELIEVGERGWWWL
jgi:hypothetical protein